ncbi:dihydrodipicolinate synthase family protein [Actinomadura sp. ATCC 31491]|uniref:Dihydrodipicolinate synthase family protein n=1 Tax=Actinomadura luzonensis TaxID=2805427 RepID=A0ABT0G1P7_9ACTN|nr:dihydrodipicolinate synthase family protein [Actinomadura luzonensis]MCK2218544.1 dihydrodipicolinate synthase family protein [Actinomadura luzonensis]
MSSTPIDARAAALRDRLRGGLAAAALTPMTRAGEVDLDVAEAYFRRLAGSGADVLAVLAHTGRGPFLAAETRAGVITRARRAGVPVIVGVGGAQDGGHGGGHGGGQGGQNGGQGGGTARAVADARMAAELGADGVLVFPEPGDRVALHEAVWSAAGLPMIAFDLYTDPCPPAALRRILDLPGVAGLKTALLSDAMGCQRTIALTREAGRLAITGEDRMFAASLLWGAQAALVGVAAASVGTTAAVLRAYEGGDLRGFEKAAARLDRLAAATFTAPAEGPMEGYVQRMAWLAAEEGLIPEEHAHDPYGPALPDGERARVLAAAR